MLTVTNQSPPLHGDAQLRLAHVAPLQTCTTDSRIHSFPYLLISHVSARWRCFNHCWHRRLSGNLVFFPIAFLINALILLRYLIFIYFLPSNEDINHRRRSRQLILHVLSDTEERTRGRNLGSKRHRATWLLRAVAGLHNRGLMAQKHEEVSNTQTLRQLVCFSDVVISAEMFTLQLLRS